MYEFWEGLLGDVATVLAAAHDDDDDGTRPFKVRFTILMLLL